MVSFLLPPTFNFNFLAPTPLPGDFLHFSRIIEIALPTT